MGTLRRTLTSVVLTILVFSLIVVGVGTERFIEAASQFDPFTVAAIVGITALASVSRSLTLHAISDRLGLGFSVPQVVRLQFSISFADTITPFAQAGGQPIAAKFLQRESDEPYSKCLASLSAVDVIDFTTSVLVFTAGCLVLLFVTPEVVSPLLRRLSLVFVGFVILVVSGFGALWRFRDRLIPVVASPVSRLSRVLSVLPALPERSREDVSAGLDQFVESVETATSHPRTFLRGLAWMVTSSLLYTLMLYLALESVGTTVPVGILLIAGPIAGIASVVPIPGGVGASEGVKIGVLSAFSGVSVTDVAVAVVVISGVGYWMTIVSGLAVLNVIYGGYAE